MSRLLLGLCVVLVGMVLLASAQSGNSSLSVEFIAPTSTGERLVPFTSSIVTGSVTPILSSSENIASTSIMLTSTPTFSPSSSLPSITPSSSILASTPLPMLTTSSTVLLSPAPSTTPSTTPPTPTTSRPPPSPTDPPVEPGGFPMAAIIGIAAGGGVVLLVVVLILLCCCAYCFCCRATTHQEYSTGNEGFRPHIVVRTYNQNVERQGSVISRGSRGSFARSSISSIASSIRSLRRLSGKRRSKTKDNTHFVNEEFVPMKVTPL